MKNFLLFLLATNAATFIGLMIAAKQEDEKFENDIRKFIADMKKKGY